MIIIGPLGNIVVVTQNYYNLLLLTKNSVISEELKSINTNSYVSLNVNFNSYVF